MHLANCRSLTSPTDSSDEAELLGVLTHDFVQALDPTKEITKEITLEMAFELTNTLDLKIVDLHSAATIKVAIKI